MNSPLFSVALFEPLIPQNTGNIGRLTTANGLTLHLIEPLGFSLDEKKVRRAGLDYWKHADIRTHDDLEHFLQSLGETRIVAYSKYGQQRHSDFQYQSGDCLLFGKETTGLPKEVLDLPQVHSVRIPMRRALVRSLNLANSVAIGCYEVLRQLEYPNERPLEAKECPSDSPSS